MLRARVVDSTEYDLFAEVVVRYAHDDGREIVDRKTGARGPFVDWRTQTDRTMADLHARAEAHAASFV